MYAASGGWLDTVGCFPVVPEPKDLYEPCGYAGQPYDGADDCRAGTVCTNLNDEGVGTCQGLCHYEDDGYTPNCEDPGATPQICQICVPCLCFAGCDPLLIDCPMHETCIPNYSQDGFVCAPDASGDGGAYGDPCEFVNACDRGLLCVSPEYVPACPENSAGCCTEFCNLSAVNTCAGAAEGQECLPYWDVDNPPPGYENLGICGTMPP